MNKTDLTHFLKQNRSGWFSYKSCRFESLNAIHYGNTKTDIAKYIFSNYDRLDFGSDCLDLVSAFRFSNGTGEPNGVPARSGFTDGIELLRKILSIQERSVGTGFFDQMHPCWMPDWFGNGNHIAMQLSWFAI